MFKGNILSVLFIYSFFFIYIVSVYATSEAQSHVSFIDLLGLLVLRYCTGAQSTRSIAPFLFVKQKQNKTEKQNKNENA